MGGGGVRFIPFPKRRRSFEKCLKWIKACGRPHDQLNIKKADYNKHLFVCSKYFIGGVPTYLYPDPIPACPTTTGGPDKPKPTRPPPKRRSAEDLVTTQNRKKIRSSSENTDAIPEQPTVVTASTSDKVEQQEASYSQEQHPGLQILALAAENQALKEELAATKQQLNDLQQAYAEQILKNVDLQRQQKEENLYSTQLTVEDVKNSHVKGTFKHYTGFDYQDFINIFHFLTPDENEVPFVFDKRIKHGKKLRLKDQVLMVFMKLRVNFHLIHLANLFKISQQHAGILFRAWVNYMFYRFGSIPIWPHRDVIIEQMPDRFKEEFPTTVVILDGTEIKVEKPSSLRTQSQCYSDYKSATTLKALVGVDPRGCFTFISMLFSGSLSDKEITKESLFLKQLCDLLRYGKLRVGDGINYYGGQRISY